jgi:hypothetical protein
MTRHPDAADVSVKDLAAALRLSAEGDWNQSAAVEMLCRDFTYLRKPDFRRYIIVVRDEDGTLGARVDWQQVHQALDAREIPGSGGERRFLRATTQRAMAELSGTDRKRVALILHGVAHSAGWHQGDGPTLLVTGRYDTEPPPDAPPGHRAPTRPTFEQSRAQARRLVGDARDEMIGDWIGSGLTSQQWEALRTYHAAIAVAEQALDAAAG